MEVGQGPNWGCSAKGKKSITDFVIVVPEHVDLMLSEDGHI
jgi:hypothetical protein